MVDRPRKRFIGTHFRGRFNRDAETPPPADGSRKSSTAAAQVANHLPTAKNKPKEKTGSFIWPQHVRRLSPMVTQHSLLLQPRPQAKLTPLICMGAICATSTARDASAGPPVVLRITRGESEQVPSDSQSPPPPPAMASTKLLVVARNSDPVGGGTATHGHNSERI